MNIRKRLTLQFTLIVSSIISIFAITIYSFSLNYRNEEFFYRIKSTAINTAKLYFDFNKIDRFSELEINEYTQTTFQDKQTYLFDSNEKPIFSFPITDSIPLNTKEIIKTVKTSGSYSKTTKTKHTIAFSLVHQNQKYFIIASANDIDGNLTLKHLKFILIIGFCILIAITSILGYFFAYKALHPIQKIVHQAKSISAENLSQRIAVGTENDEIFHLAITFNEMLNRLENAFELQKHFVANVSHELRTPLTSITGQLEVNLMNTRTVDEHKETITSILYDIKILNQLVNNLLYLTETKLDKSNIPMTNIRVDELLFLAKILEVKKHKDYTIDFNFTELPEEENQLTVAGNEQLLSVVFLNLIDNACKYSPNNSVIIGLKSVGKTIEISFTDNGIGIPKSDFENIFLPFQRANNSKDFKGHGIGLSLVKNIIEIHCGTISVDSIEGKGSTFTITLHHYA